MTGTHRWRRRSLRRGRRCVLRASDRRSDVSCSCVRLTGPSVGMQGCADLPQLLLALTSETSADSLARAVQSQRLQAWLTMLPASCLGIDRQEGPLCIAAAALQHDVHQTSTAQHGAPVVAEEDLLGVEAKAPGGTLSVSSALCGSCAVSKSSARRMDPVRGAHCCRLARAL